MKTRLRGIFTVLCGYIKKFERSYTDKSTAHFKILEQKKETSPREVEGRKNKIKLRTEINKIETKRKIQRIYETKSCLGGGIQEDIHTLI